MDFSSLVLAPAFLVFGQPITVAPVVSQPGVAPYAATGIYRAQPIDMQADDGMLVTSTKHTLGVRRSTFTIQVKAGDQITLADDRSFTVDRVHPDGQGGADLTLVQNEAAPASP